MANSLRVLPGRVNVDFWPTNPITVVLSGWAAGSLVGRTFESKLGSTPLAVAVVGDTLVITASAAITGANPITTGSIPWSVKDTSNDRTLISGTWFPMEFAQGESAVTEATVTVDDAEISLAVVDADLSPFAYPATMRLVPQWRGLPVFVYGHSLAATAGWHTVGADWPSRLAAGSGAASVTNRAVGGSQMEGTLLTYTGATASRWAPGTTKSVALHMNVTNSALSANVGHVEANSLESIKHAARSIIVATIGTLYDFTDATVFGFAGGTWGDIGSANGHPSTTYPAGAMRWTLTAGAYAAFLVPAGITNKQFWFETITVTPERSNPLLEIRKVDRFTGPLLYSGRPVVVDGAPPAGYTKYMVPCGPVSTGDTIFIRALDYPQPFYLLGAYLDNGRNHCTMVLDRIDMPSVTFPAFQQPDRIASHNAKVQEAVDEMNVLVPDSASTIDLNIHDDFDWDLMTWTGDGVHPNDRGQAWYAARITQFAQENTPWTSRLHTI